MVLTAWRQGGERESQDADLGDYKLQHCVERVGGVDQFVWVGVVFDEGEFLFE